MFILFLQNTSNFLFDVWDSFRFEACALNFIISVSNTLLYFAICMIYYELVKKQDYSLINYNPAVIILPLD